jgi:hypothetical protein
MQIFDAFVGRGRITLAVAAGLATFTASLGLANRADATTVNTFEGDCAGILGTANWPLSPLRAVPAPLRMIVTFEGGSCSGTLNGKRVDGVPLRDGYLDVYGLMGCSAGVADGRAGFSLAGRTFTGNSHYRRTGITPVVYIEGDTSGYVAGLARVLVGPGDIVPLAEQCGSEGLSQAEVMIEQFSAPLSISSPQQ